MAYFLFFLHGIYSHSSEPIPGRLNLDFQMMFLRAAAFVSHIGPLLRSLDKAPFVV